MYKYGIWFYNIFLCFPIKSPSICVPFLRGICIVEAERRGFLKTDCPRFLCLRAETHWGMIPGHSSGDWGESWVTVKGEAEIEAEIERWWTFPKLGRHESVACLGRSPDQDLSSFWRHLERWLKLRGEWDLGHTGMLDIRQRSPHLSENKQKIGLK